VIMRKSRLRQSSAPLEIVEVEGETSAADGAVRRDFSLNQALVPAKSNPRNLHRTKFCERQPSA